MSCPLGRSPAVLRRGCRFGRRDGGTAPPPVCHPDHPSASGAVVLTASTLSESQHAPRLRFGAVGPNILRPYRHLRSNPSATRPGSHLEGGQGSTRDLPRLGEIPPRTLRARVRDDMRGGASSETGPRLRPDEQALFPVQMPRIPALPRNPYPVAAPRRRPPVPRRAGRWLRVSGEGTRVMSRRAPGPRSRPWSRRPPPESLSISGNGVAGRTTKDLELWTGAKSLDRPSHRESERRQANLQSTRQ